MIFTHETKLSSEEIENRIEHEAKAFGLMMKKHFPFSKNLPEGGFEIKEHASVFELCKPPVAACLLNMHPELCAFMPCRICVYEKEGKTYASTPDLNFSFENIICDETLKKDIFNLYDNIITMIKGW